MKTQILLFSFLFIFTWGMHAQNHPQNSTLTPAPEQMGAWLNPTKSGARPAPLMAPQKQTMFNPDATAWRWDTILCYSVASDPVPFQRVTRTYDAAGMALTNTFERREGNLTWENFARESFAYDSAGNWINHLQEVWQNNGWVNYMKQEFSYNANGDMKDWKRWLWDSTYWANADHYAFHFNANGLRDTTIYKEGQDSLWINNYRGISTYDSNDQLTTVLHDYWINNGWETTKNIVYTYDTNGFTQTLITQNWVNSAWVNNEFYHYTRDTAGVLLTWLYQLWQNNGWENSELTFYTYDANGKKVVWLTQFWYNGAWFNSGRTLYNYDASSNLLSATSQDWVNAAWQNANTDQFTYDTCGNSLTGKDMHWYNGWNPQDGGLAVYADHQQDIVLQGLYRYEAVIDSILVFTGPAPSTGEVTLYPNPASNMVYVSMPSATDDTFGSVALYDLRGQLLLTTKLINETTSMDIGRLKPGVYFVRLSNNHMVRVLKLVKE